MRKIVVMIGSDSDLPQCEAGFNYLLEAEKKGMAKVVNVITNSIHRNTMDTIMNLNDLAGRSECCADVLIAGAGMANHLTGTADAYLRNYLKNDEIKVIGVAFKGKTGEDTLAAVLSIEKIPGTQVIFDRRDMVGSDGFLKACELAVIGNLPEIKIPEGKSWNRRSLERAIEKMKEIKKEKGVK
ncbi:AIR carboxylase [bacterium BMS3Abin15]|nr:AIR carboxylase [bacterium BMS3Abin15]HDZ86039.1 hypothetical protein [Candidatus Moranbacteria bacterium]